MFPCPQCQKLVIPGAPDCPSCGHIFGVIEPNGDAGPKGIGGWLIVPLLGLIVSPIRIIFQTTTNLLPLLNTSTWSALTNPSSSAYHSLLGPLIIFELVANATLVIFGFWVFAAFVTKSSVTPRLYIVWLSAFVAVQVADLAVGSQIPVVAAQLDHRSLGDLFRAVVGASIWIPYFLRSKRVANTFVN